MTEEEARGKWCPFTAVKGNNINCIASKCMAWRTTNQIPQFISINHMAGNEIADYLNKGWHLNMQTLIPPKAKRQNSGHCGLAGPV